MGVICLFPFGLDGSPGPGTDSCPPKHAPCPVCVPLGATLSVGGRPVLSQSWDWSTDLPREHGYLRSECNPRSIGFTLQGTKVLLWPRPPWEANAPSTAMEP